MRRVIKISSLITMVIALGSCASTNQKLLLAEIDVGKPISGSKSMLIDGKTIGDKNLSNKTEFTIVREVSLPIKAKEGLIDINSDLKKELQDYDGVIGLKMKINNIHSSDISWLAFERYLGSFLVLFGGYYFAAIGTYSTNPDYQLGFVLIGSGLSLFGGSILYEALGKIKYDIEFSGTKVDIQKE